MPSVFDDISNEGKRLNKRANKAAPSVAGGAGIGSLLGGPYGVVGAALGAYTGGIFGDPDKAFRQATPYDELGVGLPRGFFKGTDDEFNYAGRYPRDSAMAVARGESPGQMRRRKQREARRREQEALRVARQLALMARSRGITGGAGTGMVSEGTADLLAQLQQQDDMNQRNLDAQSLQTIQALLFLAGAL